MIITQTPFRMSFFGGGTDMESFFRENGGAVLSTTFDKYCYVNDSGLIIANKNGSVEKWLAKEDERPTYYKNRVNAGLHVSMGILTGKIAPEAGKD